MYRAVVLAGAMLLLATVAAADSVVGTMTVQGRPIALKHVAVARQADAEEPARAWLIILVSDAMVAASDRTPARLTTRAREGKVAAVRVCWLEGTDLVVAAPYHRSLAQTGRRAPEHPTLNLDRYDGRRYEGWVKSKMLGQDWFFEAHVKAAIDRGGTADLEQLADETPPTTADWATDEKRRKKLALAKLGYEYNVENLDAAILDANVDAVRLFMELGMSPNAAGASGEPLLERATLICTDKREAEATAIVRLLLAAGAKVDGGATDGITPLLRAAQYCSGAEIVQVLVEAGANVNTRAPGSATPLFWATFRKLPEMEKVLRQAGATEGAVAAPAPAASAPVAAAAATPAPAAPATAAAVLPAPAPTTPAPGAVAPVVVPQALPTAFQFDGAVAEWRDLAPLARLGPADTLPGHRTPASASDASAVVWLAFTREGITLAADVTDDAVTVPEDQASVEQKDHLALWLAFPPATMPDLGFWYIQDVDGDSSNVDAAWCEGEAGLARFDTVEACRAWVDLQLARREGLSRLFVRRFLVSGSGVKEAHASASEAPAGHETLPFEPPTGCAGCTAKLVSRMGGYSLEARLPLSALPAAAQDPLAAFRYRLDLVDTDAAAGAAAVLSTERSGGDAVSAQAGLDPPRLFESQPPMLARLLVDDGTFFFPAEPVTAAYGFANKLLGFERAADVDSPSVVEITFPKEPALRVGTVEVYEAPTFVGGGGAVKQLSAFKNGASVASLEFSGRCQEQPSSLFTKNLGACTLAAFACEGMANAAGVGPCGACPSMDYDVVAIDASGRMTLLSSGDLICSIELEMGPETASGFTAKCLEEEEPKSIRVRWSDFKCPK